MTIIKTQAAARFTYLPILGAYFIKIVAIAFTVCSTLKGNGALCKTHYTFNISGDDVADLKVLIPDITAVIGCRARRDRHDGEQADDHHKDKQYADRFFDF